jgi:hypothetical protein
LKKNIFKIIEKKFGLYQVSFIYLQSQTNQTNQKQINIMKKAALVFVGSQLVKTINCTKDSLGAKKLVGVNRPTNEEHIKALMVSFTLFGTARVVITLVRTRAFGGQYEYYIADGQHSLIACKRLDVPFSVLIVELDEDTKMNVTQYVAALNNTSKAWSTKNYLQAYCDNGVREYQKAVKIINETGLTVTDFEQIYLGGGGSKEHKSFKNGTMKFVNEADSDKLLDAVMMVKPYVPNKAFARRSLYKVMRMTADYKKFAKVIVKAAKALAESESKFSENEEEFLNHLIKLNAKYCA